MFHQTRRTIPFVLSGIVRGDINVRRQKNNLQNCINTAASNCRQVLRYHRKALKNKVLLFCPVSLARILRKLPKMSVLVFLVDAFAYEAVNFELTVLGLRASD